MKKIKIPESPKEEAGEKRKMEKKVDSNTIFQRLSLLELLPPLKRLFPVVFLFLTLRAFSEEIPAWIPEAPDVRGAYDLIRAEEIPGTPPVVRTVSLNGEWRTSCAASSAVPFPDDVDRKEAYAETHFDDSAWKVQTVPGKTVYALFPELPDTKRPYMKAWSRKKIVLSGLGDRRAILKFDRAGYECVVFVNGRRIGMHKGSFTPFEMDVTDAVREGENGIALRFRGDLGHTGGIAPQSHVYGAAFAPEHHPFGLCGPVVLSLEPPVRIRAMRIVPRTDTGELEAELRVENHTGKPLSVQLDAKVTPAVRKDADKVAGSVSRKDWNLLPGSNVLTIRFPLKNPRFWSPGSPYLYFLTADLRREGTLLSRRSERFGYRDFRVRNGKFYLNGEECYLFGAYMHAISFPAGDRWHATRLLEYKKQGYNIARSSHDPLLPEVLAAADEQGFMIYHEWAWSFLHNLRFREFEANNQAELKEFIAYSHNHPSVVMWSLGNEINHRNPEVNRLLNLQAATVRTEDLQKRPLCAFSGSGAWNTYGSARLETDFFDVHNYCGLGSPWTTFREKIDELLQGLRKIYGEQKVSETPFCAWELIGFSWGAVPDKTFRRGSISDYAAYMGKPSSWGAPNGVGFTGSVPLFKALQTGFSRWAQGYYAHRILELIRVDERHAGFAPWFHNHPMAYLWNQPVYFSIHDEHFLFPRNLFNGEKSSWILEIANTSPETLENPVLELSLFDGKNPERPLEKIPLSRLGGHSRSRQRMEIRLPGDLKQGNFQLRGRLCAGGKEVSRNFYNLFAAPRSRKVLKPSAPVYLLDTGSARNLQLLSAYLKERSVEARPVKRVSEIAGKGILIVPPETLETQRIDLGGADAFDAFVRRGGILLILEQKNPESRMPGGLSLTPGGRPFVDLVTPGHPLFRGLDWTEFDTWTNGESGFVVSHTYQPYALTALAVKGPSLGGSEIGNAVMEAVLGSGRILCSQLNAFSSRETDSAAWCYLDNLMRYVLESPDWQEAMPLAAAVTKQYDVLPERCVPIDLRPYATTSFSDEKEGDRKGGWFDQGSNDFRSVPLGRQSAGGVPFDIIRPAENGGRSCIVLRGGMRPYFPSSVKGIRAEGKFSRLFFLHTAAWAFTGRSPGCYRIRYENGKQEEFRLICNVNIGDWWNIAPLPEAKTGLMTANSSGHTVGSYVAAWENPHPDWKIVSVDVLSAEEARGTEVDWLPSDAPVPALIALTGERFAETPHRILDSQYRGVLGCANVFRKDGIRMVGIRFPARKQGEEAHGVIRFNPEGIDPDCRLLTLRIRSDRASALLIRLPERKWRGVYSGVIALKGDGKFHTYRLFLGKELTAYPPVSLQTLRGELFFSPGTPGPQPALNLTVSAASLE